LFHRDIGTLFDIRWSIQSIYFILPEISRSPISSTRFHIPEPDLVNRLQSRDRTALDYLYDHYASALYGVVYRVIQKEDIAEEVLQDVFLKIWDKIDQYNPSKGKLFTWMLNIARNHAIDKMRSKEISKEQKTRAIENVVSRVEAREPVEQRVEDIGIKDIIKSLPDEQQFVVDHLYFRGYSQAELADEFNIPLGTVKTRLRLAMQSLRETLNVT
jgi:RNA polymerase sigma factor (sigma-70 family)